MIVWLATVTWDSEREVRIYYFVLRFLAEDVGKELDLVLDAVLRVLTHRTQSASPASALRILRRPPS